GRSARERGTGDERRAAQGRRGDEGEGAHGASRGGGERGGSVRRPGERRLGEPPLPAHPPLRREERGGEREHERRFPQAVRRLAPGQGARGGERRGDTILPAWPH